VILSLGVHPERVCTTPPVESENLTNNLQYIVIRKRCERGYNLVLITSRKSQMSFRLVPKPVTLDDLERRNGPYFHRIW